MSARRPSPRFSTATNARIARRNQLRRERVLAVVRFMDVVEGYGWKRRMEIRDKVLDQDSPRSWLNGRKIVSEAMLRKFEDYAARFGYVVPPREGGVFVRQKSIVESLNNL